ncbi:MAG: nucleotide exchange factor GrpE [Candidatus Methanomethylophilus sp.]|nr:nucleotide exchange factor GrpE [Methanomethylophilus sp.]MDD3233583.1 nucleotide exchange factor GrpE [Methanomethylophilus sp.]MDD4222632.1 nucleotide exchange factor GrpE [Methanomethylophilus sp.]
MTGKSDKKAEQEAPKAKEAGASVKAAKGGKGDEFAQFQTENEKLRADLEKAQQQAGEYLQMAQRLQAEFDNFRKRTERDNAEFRKYANQNLVADLLNVADDLERALSAVKQDDSVAAGVKAVRTNLMKILEQNGLQEIPTDGKFDPNLHEAMIVADGDEDDRIAEVYQKGYIMNGRVLRTAKVKVTKKKAAAEAAAQQKQQQ